MPIATKVPCLLGAFHMYEIGVARRGDLELVACGSAVSGGVLPWSCSRGIIAMWRAKTVGARWTLLRDHKTRGDPGRSGCSARRPGSQLPDARQ